MLQRIAKYIPLALFLALQCPLPAQNFSRHNWFFGNSSDAIIFNKSDNEPMWVDIQGTPYGSGGSAVATDPLTGDVLFYTDGLSVIDASHNVMVNGIGLNGISSSNQQVGICPDPNNNDQYFIFTNSANQTNPGNIEYTKVDMSLPGNAGLFAPNLGSVIGMTNVSTGVGNTSEAMAVIPNPSFTGCWVVTQNYGTSVYNVFEVSSGGFGNTQSFDLALAGAPPLVAANFAYTSLDGGKIAVSPQNSNKNVQILNFNASTGTISFKEEIPNTGNNDGASYAVYDTEWSSDGTKLYISRFGSDSSPTGRLLQYDPIAPNVQIVPTGNLNRSLGLRLGPDDRIYHLYEVGSGQLLVGRIDLPNQVIDSINYDATPPEVGNISYNGRQFPEFAFARRTSNSNMFMVMGQCTNSPTQFFPNVDPMADDFSWIIGGTSSKLLAPSVTFSSGGVITC